MPFNGSGQFTPKHVWVNEAAANTPMLPANFDDQDTDMAQGLSNTILRDGTGGPTADIPWNNFGITGLRAPALAADAATKKYVDDVDAATRMWVGGTTTALPAQAGNAGKVFTTDGSQASWTSSLKASIIRFADGTDATKLAAFDLSALTTGTTRTYALPDASGTLALRTDLPPPFPTLIIREELASGSNGGATVAGDQTRFFNSVVKNTIPGASVVSGNFILPGGTYKIAGGAPASGSTSHKAYLVNTSNSATLINGTSEGCGTSGIQTRSMIEGEFFLSGTATLSLHHTTSNAVSFTGQGIPRGAAGLTEVYAQLVIQKVA